jgi:tetratricopeptide (TPR) repeat protein
MGERVELQVAEAAPVAAPDAAALVARAEALRRDGRVDAALEVAREALAADPRSVSARASAALALLDLGRDAEARRELEALVAEDAPDAAPLEAFDDGELEQAFAEAEPEAEAMHDANEVAFEAMRAVERELSDPTAANSPFRTRTMAELLERQGDRDAARAIRASLAESDDAGAAQARGGRRRGDVIRTLERWLERVRRGDQ